MKHITLLYCALFTGTILYGSEQQKQLELIKQIDCTKIAKTLNDNYIAYARKHLEKYKTTNYTVQEMCNIGRKNQFMTGEQYGGFPYNAIRDEQGNSFIRIAVNKMDLTIVDWHVLKQGAHCITQEDFNYCSNLCFEKLNPKKTEEHISEKATAYTILKILATKQGDTYTIWTLRPKLCRENFVKQLILLQIKQKRYKSDFIIEDEFIAQHLTGCKDDQSPILLTDMYQTVANKKGNTLSHIVVELQAADELCTLINKNYVSAAPNKIGKTIDQLALHHFQMFTQDTSNFDLYPENGKNARCCLFMLLKYIISKQNGSLTPDYTCCDKHAINI